MLTVIIPARAEAFLQKTIDNVLENADGEIEIITICDGWKPDTPLRDHDYLRVIYNNVARGQRMAINDAAKIALGDYVMKLDAHCAVGPGFNTILERDCEYDMTMIPEMYNLDIGTWKPKYFDDYDEAISRGKVNPYMYIGLVDGNLRAQYYSGRKSRAHFRDRKDVKIDETMCCMGPSFFMHKERFWELGGCDEGHGHWGQQGVEVACKAWLSGGRLMVNKNTWFAHWFRGGHVHEDGRKGFPYSMRQTQVNKARAYSNDLWMNDKWPQQKKSFYWLLKKFDPPTWESINVDYPTEEKRAELLAPFYKHIHRRKNDASYKGVPVLKLPNDLILYQEAIWEKRPEVIVEIGTKWGGSALYFQDTMDTMYEGGKIITIDIKSQIEESGYTKDPRITYLIGNSMDDDIIDQVKEFTEGKKTMLVIDGNHSRVHVKNELHKYRHIVSPGQYMVVEDCYIDRGLYGPGEARNWFLERYNEFEQTNRCKKYLIGITMGGWLLKK